MCIREITVTVNEDHRMIPPFSKTVAKINKLTGREARPNGTGLQANPPFKIVFIGSEEDLQTVKGAGFNAEYT